MEIKMDKVSYVINPGTSIEKTILKDVSFTIDKTDIYAFVGDSGSGKTALGNIIDSLIKPTHGACTIDFESKKIRKVSDVRKYIGIVKTNPYDMFFNKTVYKEISYGLINFNYKKKSKEDRIKDACKLFDIDESLLNENPFNLSLVDAKKVSLASVFIFNPSVIILDDIEIGLNSYEKEELIRILSLIKNKYNKTIILLTKDTDFAYLISSYVFVLYKTKILRSGSVSILEDKELLKECNLKVPFIVDFIYEARKKDINLSFTKDIRDLIKEVYRNVR